MARERHDVFLVEVLIDKVQHGVDALRAVVLLIIVERVVVLAEDLLDLSWDDELSIASIDFLKELCERHGEFSLRS